MIRVKEVGPVTEVEIPSVKEAEFAMGENYFSGQF
jgi:hypothetical protein